MLIVNYALAISILDANASTERIMSLAQEIIDEKKKTSRYYRKWLLIIKSKKNIIRVKLIKRIFTICKRSI